MLLEVTNHEQSSQNNQSTFSLKYWGVFFPKKAFHGGTNFFGQIYGEVILNGKINDRIISRWGRSFINDKNIFQSSERCKYWNGSSCTFSEKILKFI